MIRLFSDLSRAGALVALASVQALHAADVTSYWVRKGALLEQTSPTAPVPVEFTPNSFIARVNGDLSAISQVNLSTESQLFPLFPLTDLGDRLEYSVDAGPTELDALFPAGNYTFIFDEGSPAVPFSLPTAVYPTPVPHVLNYAAAQAVNPASPFTLTFTPFTGAVAGDVYELEIIDVDGSILFQTSGTGTTATIPAGTLSSGESYDTRLRFVHNTSTDTTGYPGATGSAGFFKETRFIIDTAGGNGGNDTTPPTLVATTPASGATGVAVNTPIMFIFSEPMARQQAIQWSANVTPANFNYSWGIGDLFLTATYLGGLPANATITWSLTGGANGFRDVAGNPLAPAQGSFTTGTGGGNQTNNPCISTNETPSGAGSGFLFKSLEFVQTGNTAPVPDTENPASAFASYRSATNHTVTSVRVTGPNNIDLTLETLAGFYFLTQDFPNAAAMESFLPAGNYTISATGAGSGTLALPNATTIPVPRINNLVELMAFDPTKDFVLQFAPFTGAGQNDSIFISLQGNDNRHFYAPDFCLGRELPNTATSVVIPANTFMPGDQLSGSISFTRSAFNTNAIVNTFLTASATAQTTFEFTVGGGNPGSQIRWTSSALTNGIASFAIQAPVGTNLLLEASTNLTAWSQAGPLPTTNGSGMLSTNTATPRYRFFRARAQ